MQLNIDATQIPYAQLNQTIRQQPGDYSLLNVNGQRYIGCGLGPEYSFDIYGTPGNDLGAFMDGAKLNVFGNCQDATGNTMNQGRIVVHGNASDTVGYAMRNGQIFIQGNAGYRVAIHIKQYGDDVPNVVVGGKTGSFLGEYMAGGIVLVLGLGLEPGEEITGSHCATGMHGGVIYLAQDVPDYKIGFAMNKTPISQADEQVILPLIAQYSQYFGVPEEPLDLKKFVKIQPRTSRPYGKMYVGN